MSADIERHAYRPSGNVNRCAECYCPRSHSIHQVTAHDAHIAAIGGRCSHGGHGWEDTCSDIDDALAGRDAGRAMYELMLGDNRVVRWPGDSGEDAAARYVDAHREAAVIAWRADRSAPVMALTRGCVIDGQRIT